MNTTIKNSLARDLNKYINCKMTKELFNNIVKSAQDTLNKSNKLDDINNHIDIRITQGVLDPTKLNIQLISKDYIGASFLRDMNS